MSLRLKITAIVLGASALFVTALLLLEGVEGFVRLIPSILATLAIALLAHVTLIRVVARRLLRLTDDVERVVLEGDDDTWVVAEGSDEIAELGARINAMLAALRASEQEVRESHLRLEERVAERTAELATANEALREEMRARHRARSDHSATEQRLQALVDTIPDALLILDHAGNFTFANAAAERLLEMPVDRITLLSYTDIVEPAHLGQVSDHLAQRAPSARVIFETQLLTGAGDVVPVELSQAGVFDLKGRPEGYQWIARDVSERRRYEERLIHVADHDHLTGLFNRRRFEEELAREIRECERHGESGCVLWLDIDHFKETNDSFGHAAGDQLLSSFAARLAGVTRGYSTLARIGGDEFAVLLPHAGESEGLEAAARILAALRAEDHHVGEHRVRVNASIGVITYPDEGSSPDELLAKADLAMYQAKAEGGGRALPYRATGDRRERMRDRVAWAERITAALESDGFAVHAQPIRSIATGAVDRYELLIRLRGDAGELIPPATFLPAAERFGLIHEIDRWMIGCAAGMLARDARRGGSLHLDVNLSGRAFDDEGLLGHVASTLEEHGVSPDRLGMEVTETAAILDMAKAEEFIGRLREIGCRFSLDDFGTGFSSFFYLRHLPVDRLKIDGTYIRDLTNAPVDQHLVRAIVEMCRGLGITTTAEFVGDAETLELLAAIGVDHAQGYHLGMPLDVTTLFE